MKPTRALSPLVILLFGAISLAVVACDLPGTVTISSMGNIGGRGSGEFLSVHGHRRLSPTRFEDVGVLYGVILNSSCITRYGRTSSDYPVSEMSYGYSLERIPARALRPDEQSFVTIRINLKKLEATVGSKSFDLREGNIFVIRLNGNCELAATEQLPYRFERPASPSEIVNRLQALLPNDSAIQGLAAIE